MEGGAELIGGQHVCVQHQIVRCGGLADAEIPKTVDRQRREGISLSEQYKASSVGTEGEKLRLHIGFLQVCSDPH